MEFRTTQRRSRPGVLLSIAAHVAVLGSFLFVGTRTKGHVLPPANRCCMAMLMTAGGSHTVTIPDALMPSTGRSQRPDRVPATQPRLANPVKPLQAAKASAPTTAPQTSNMGTGTAVSGNGSDSQNATPAFPVFSPKPPVMQRALLPTAEQQIVVDVNVSEQGEVVAESLVKGMGNDLDQIVLDTVKTWRFHPATVNGNPVASEAELIFPFNPNYPITRG